MDFDKVVNSRFSVRKYLSKKPDWRDIVDAVESASHIPLAGGIPSVKFIIIDDSKIIEGLAETAQQDFIAKAHYAVVVVSDPKDVVRAYDEIGINYVRQQAGAAIEQFLLKLTDVGLGGCWVGAFVESQVKILLKIPESSQVEAIIPIGYPFGKPLRRKSVNMDRMTYFNKYGQKQMRPRKIVDAA